MEENLSYPVIARWEDKVYNRMKPFLQNFEDENSFEDMSRTMWDILKKAPAAKDIILNLLNG